MWVFGIKDKTPGKGISVKRKRKVEPKRIWGRNATTKN